MKKLLLIPMFFLYACSTSTSPSSYTCAGSGRGCHSIIPQQPNNFVNVAAMSNSNLTDMLSRNETQVAAYIKNRLIGLDLESTTQQENLQIAQLALWLVNASAEDIDTELSTNRDNVHRAMYVITNKLNSCFDSTNISECFINWKDSVGSAAAISALKTNAQILSIDNARFTSSEINDSAILQFNINDSGKITNISIIKDNGNDEKVFSRDGDTNKFDGSITVGDETYDTLFTYNSFGKQMGLLYSDFGIYSINSNLSSEVHEGVPFAGGYPEKRIQETNIATDLSFSGKAAGTVISYKNGADNPQVINLENGRAFLTFDKTTNPSSPSTKITANFDNWYMVLITKGETDTINFESYKENAEGYDMRMLSQAGVFYDPIEADTTTVNYYGENPTSGIPTEATGLTTFRDCGTGVACTGNYNETPEIRLDMSFGVQQK